MKIVFDSNYLVKIFKDAEAYLFDSSNISAVSFLDRDTVSDFNINNKELLDKLKDKNIVYCIWCGDSDSNIKPCYVGHVNQHGSRGRMVNHLSKSNKATGTKLKQIKEAVECGKIIGLTFLVIDPPYMRTALENWLIENNSRKLEWNKNGRKRLSKPIRINIEGADLREKS